MFTQEGQEIGITGRVGLYGITGSLVDDQHISIQRKNDRDKWNHRTGVEIVHCGTDQYCSSLLGKSLARTSLI